MTQSRSNAGRWCGPLLAATGLIHLAYGVGAGWDSLVTMARGGINGVDAAAHADQVPSDVSGTGEVVDAAR